MKAPRPSHAPGRADINRTRTDALSFPRSIRRHTARGITSLPAGYSVPIFASGLLREDAVRSGRLRFNFEMMETAEIIMNPINVRIMAYLVPNLALERFQGSLDILNRSYAGEPPMDGETPIPFIETDAFGAHGSNEIYKYLGLHGRPDQMVSTAYIEGYNQIQNLRRRNRSPKLTMRNRLDTDLAEAFWHHEQFAHVVPSFDQAAIDGAVMIDLVSARIPVSGIGVDGRAEAYNGTNDTSVVGRGDLRLNYKDSAGNSGAASAANKWFGRNGAPQEQQMAAGGPLIKWSAGGVVVQEDADNPGFPAVFAELESAGVSLSLSNIELAKRTAAFAQIRKQYNGHTDEWIIDQLMTGISIPDQAFKQPMLIGERSTIVGMAKRYATDGGNLAESAVNGATSIDLSIQVPRVPMGGIIMIIAEITPEQLFERQTDPFLVCTDVADFPDALRDDLDSVKVMVVPNEYVDVRHTQPEATFGYAPNNFMWNITSPRVGGKFLRPTNNTTFDEDRQRIWSGETVDPTLAEDFYLCTKLHQKPFAITTGDTFEVVTMGELFIEGNTQFGTPLIEGTDDYMKILEKAPTDVITQE